MTRQAKSIAAVALVLLCFLVALFDPPPQSDDRYVTDCSGHVYGTC